MRFLSPKVILLTSALIGWSAHAESSNDFMLSMDSVANYTVATTSNHSRGLRAERSLATCGNGNRGDGVCSNGQCCSQFGWCGTSSAHCTACGNGNRGNGVCANGQCCSQFGWCGTTTAHCGGGPAPAPVPAPVGGTCGNGSRGNGVCANGQCCSQFGWCGTSSTHCTGTAPTPTGGTTTGGSVTISSPARTLTIQDVQAGMDRYNQLQGGSERATQDLVNTLNAVTKSYSIYRQLAFVAQTIWESGAYRYREEIAATTGCTATACTKYDYQRCTDQSIVPNGDRAYYGRGYIQLSWCYNYEAYGRARLVNGDPNYFKNNPNIVAQLPYVVDSAAWYFETNVADASGQFGLTTKAINGGIECNGSGHHAPPKRFQIFEAMAQRVGLTGYSAAGC